MYRAPYSRETEDKVNGRSRLQSRPRTNGVVLERRGLGLRPHKLKRAFYDYNFFFFKKNLIIFSPLINIIFVWHNLILII